MRVTDGGFRCSRRAWTARGLIALLVSILSILFICIGSGASSLAAPQDPPTATSETPENPDGPPHPAPEGRPIRAIEIRGLTRQGEGAVRSRMKLQIGDLYRERELNREIQRLWKTNEFSRINEPLVLVEGDGVKLVFYVQEKVRITKLRFEGNSKVSRSDLETILKTRAGGLYTPLNVTIDLKRIRGLYRSRGFFFVQVLEDVRDDRPPPKPGESEEDRKPASSVSITFRIQEGPRVTVRSVKFLGADTFLPKQLTKVMATRPRSAVLGIPHSGVFDVEILNRDLENLRQFYRQKGFLSVVVAAEDFAFSPDRQDLHLGIRIVEGERYSVRAIEFDIVGDGVFTEAELRREVPLQAGQPYDGERSRVGAAAILKLYKRRAYIDARVNTKFSHRLEGNELTVIYHVVEGNEVTIEGVEIRGNIETRDKVIRRELTFYPLEKYDQGKVDQSTSNLYRLNYFDKVDVTTEPGSTPSLRNAVVNVNETNTGQFLFGFGVSSGLGFIGNIRLVKRNFDIMDPPESFLDLPNAFTGGGQTLVIEAQPGAELSRYQATFIEPYLFDTNTSLSLRGQRNTFTRFEYEEKRTGFRMGLGHRFLDKRLLLELTYRYDLVEISDIEPDAPPDAFAVEGSNRVSALGLEATFDKRTYRPILGPVDGWLARGGYEYAGGFLGADVDMSKATGSFSVHRTLYSTTEVDRHILTWRNTVQWAEPHHNTSDIPIFERYFMGGPRTVRGFRFLELGPHFEREPIGGAFGHYGSVEYTFPLYDTFLRGIGFVDYGNLATTFQNFEHDELRLTVGGGVILNINLFGQRVPISLTWGEAVLEEDQDRTRLFLFDIGRVGF